MNFIPCFSKNPPVLIVHDERQEHWKTSSGNCQRVCFCLHHPWDLLCFLILVSVSVVFVATLLCQSYANWMENPVITSLQDTSRSVKNMKYPAITICSEGLNMMAVDRALQREFRFWKEDRERKKRVVFYTEEKEQFLNHESKPKDIQHHLLCSRWRSFHQD